MSDLKKIEAHVRITCRACGFEDDWTREALARHLFEIGGSEVWSEITRYLYCRRLGCGSPDLQALPVPYARRPANMTRRVGRFDAQLLGTAMKILEQAVARSRTEVVATLEVRLALLVVHRYARDKDPVRRFWTRASLPIRTTNDSLHEPLHGIRHRLEGQGWLAPSTTLVDRAKCWPWESPAPPGWRAPRHRPRPANQREEEP